MGRGRQGPTPGCGVVPRSPPVEGSEQGCAGKLWVYQPCPAIVWEMMWLHSLLTSGPTVPRPGNVMLGALQCSFEQNECLRLSIKNVLMSVKCLKLKWDMKRAFS